MKKNKTIYIVGVKNINLKQNEENKTTSMQANWMHTGCREG